jgi:hypothetical protein
MEKERKEILKKLGADVGWASVGFEGWNKGQSGNVGKIRLNNSGKKTSWSVTIGEEVTPKISEKLMALMKLTYDPAKATINPLKDIYADKPTGHAQLIRDENGEVYSYYNGVFKPIFSMFDTDY